MCQINQRDTESNFKFYVTMLHPMYGIFNLILANLLINRESRTKERELYWIWLVIWKDMTLPVTTVLHHQLGQMLLKRKISMIGTIRKNKGYIPTELLQTKNVPTYTSKFAFFSDTILVPYRPEKTNKCVALQSTIIQKKYQIPKRRNLKY